ncbi:choice-of-anchor M domain-containing protein [Kineosporia sp. J2-2]|uniref:Choice-of-anchor M domain-containing protein n=1 Tax=Kineosporia corallincola TaxID=2835133 RepID=A0ABS5TTF5_9ACTN|nr:choice-of-anchor M domain-containing protein [Kineosporia corallincola]MBT0774024.1 choice-of-anchor M domain-containing protein [Kineosporia corallincola]
MQYIHPGARAARLGLTGAFLGALIALAPAVPASAQSTARTPDGRTVLGAGVHVDAIYPEIENGELDVRALTPDGVVDTDEVALHLPATDTSHVKLPAGYEFLAPEGTEAWVTTEAQDPSVVWPGWSFEGIERGVLQGTVEIAYDSMSYAGDSDDPRFAITQPGGFDGTKVTPVIVPGTVFTSTSGEVGAHTHATWSFTAEGTYDIDFTVNATLADGKEISDDATVRFVVGDLPTGKTDPEPVTDPEATDSIQALTVVPSKVDAEYFVGQTINLTALSPEAGEKDTYRWYTTAPGASEAVQATDQTTNVFSTKPIRSIDGSSVYVERVDGDGEVAETSEPITLGVRANVPTTTLTVAADKDTYAAGETAKFTSTQSPQTEDEHYHWYLKTADATEYEWIPESRLADQELEITPEMNGATITTRLFNADHAVLAEAAPIRLSVTGDDVTPLEVTSDRSGYATGDTATFQASGLDDGATVAWSVRKAGENVFEPLDAGTGTSITPAVGADWDGAEIQAVASQNGEVTAQGSLLSIHTTDSASAQEAGGDEAQESSGSVVLWIVVAVVAILVIAAIVLLVLRRRGRTPVRDEEETKADA